MENNHYIDKPITNKQNDHFERAAFAEKIASICTGKTSHSLVVGIYGKWGEGKTSLINMVGASLPDEVIKVNFNPWFFKDENQLILAFFHSVANALEKDINTTKEKIIKTLDPYKNAIGLIEEIPYVGLFAKLASLFRPLAKVKKLSVENAKKRVDEFIIDSGKNIVIFIDDIDRLDVNEIGVVFKLVKLLADFPRTTYILSFDIELVAKMLAPQYGGELEESGYKFLEKIIQVPLALPKARQSDLKSYIQKTIESTFDFSAISEKRFEEAYIDGVIPMLANPRKAIRLSNAIQFGYPLVKGEVNPSDFILIESIRSALPDFYSFIRDNKSIFLDNYINDVKDEQVEIRESAMKLVDIKLSVFPDATQRIVKKIVCTMFPTFVWVHPSQARLENPEIWITQKRICSQFYFDRYFSYSLHKGEISDRYFDEWYIKTENNSVDEMVAEYKKHFTIYSASDIIFKLVYYRDILQGKAAGNLILALCQVSSFFEKSEFEIGSTFSLAALTIQRLIENLADELKLPTAVNCVQISETLYFSAELVARFVMPESSDNPRTIFGGNRAKVIKQTFIDRIKNLVNQNGFMSLLDEKASVRWLIWWNDINKSELSSLIKNVLEEDSLAALNLLKIFTPTVTSFDGTETKTFKSDFGIQEFQRIENIVGSKQLYDRLILEYGDQTGLEKINTITSRDPLDDLTLIGIFQRMYNFQ